MENKILQLIEKNGQASLMKDISPLLLEEFGAQPLNGAVLNMMQDYVTQLIYACALSWGNMVCIPVFTMDSMSGGVVVSDMIYKKI